MTPPQGWSATLIEYLGIELWRIPIVMLSAAGIYCAFWCWCVSLGCAC